MFLDIPLFGYMPLAALITYIPVFIRVAALKKLRRLDNVEPRTILRHQALLDDKSPEAGVVRRAHAAHENGMESLIFFFAAVLAAKVADVDPAWAKSCATVYIIARLAFTYVYVYKANVAKGVLRSACYSFGYIACITLMISAAKASSW